MSDIYDKKLAEDSTFGYILALATQYFRNGHLYRKNVCETVLKGQRAKPQRDESA